MFRVFLMANKQQIEHLPVSQFRAIDFFCGGGGMTCGLRQAGIDVVAGVDFDKNAKTNAQFFGIEPNTTPPARQKYYFTLRGFIIGQQTKRMKRQTVQAEE